MYEKNLQGGTSPRVRRLLHMVLCSVAALVAFGGAPLFAQNLLTNPTFDTDVAGWNAGYASTLAWDSRDANGSGASGSALVTNVVASNSSSFASATQCVAIAPSFQYTLSGQVFTAAGQPRGKARVRIAWYSDANCTSQLTTITSGPTNKTNQWQTRSISGVSPANAHSAAATLVVTKQPNSGGSPLAVNFDSLTMNGAPGAFSFSSPVYSVSETGVQATITVSRALGSTGTVGVNYATSNGTATAGSDYTATSGTLTFGAGVTSQTFTVDILDDAAVETDETVNLTLNGPTGGATLGAQNTATLTIVDDDVALPGSVEFVAEPYSVDEGIGAATIHVIRVGGSSGAIAVDFATSDGTATVAGNDYVANSGTLTWADGEVNEKTFTVAINDDTAVEPDETLNVTLSNPQGGATINLPDATTVTILNNDFPVGDFQLSAPTYSVGEAGPSIDIIVNRINGTSGDVTVHFVTTDGTATSNSDYTPSDLTMFFLAGDTTDLVTIPIIQDTAVEGDETVTISLDTPTGGAGLASPSTATLTILDDDCPSAPVASGPASVCALTPLELTAVGSPDFVSYQWYLNGNPISGATSSTYAVASASVADGGTYTVAGISACGTTAESNGVVVSVLDCSLSALSLGHDITATVGSNGNRVVEPGETVNVNPTWQNIGSTSLTLTGSASAFTGPGSSTLYTIMNGSADYGTLLAGQSGTCTSCYVMSVGVPTTRPAIHWDATFTEDLTTSPASATPAKQWTVHIGNSFSDVPLGASFYRFVETVLHNGITSGCGGTNYCPANSVTRAQMAVFLLLAEHGPTYNPPPATGTVFGDVPANSFAAKFIEQLAAEGITGGCGGGMYCPNGSVSRAQMAVFLLVARYGTSYAPPPATGTMFTDVPLGSFADKWIEELAREGITGGCGGGKYCPGNPNTRGQMSVFLTTTFGLTQ